MGKMLTINLEKKKELIEECIEWVCSKDLSVAEAVELLELVKKQILTASQKQKV